MTLLPGFAKAGIDKDSSLGPLTIDHHVTVERVPRVIQSRISQPVALELPAGVGALFIGTTAEAFDAVDAIDVGRLVEFIDIRKAAAQRASGATARLETDFGHPGNASAKLRFRHNTNFQPVEVVLDI